MKKHQVIPQRTAMVESTITQPQDYILAGLSTAGQ